MKIRIQEDQKELETSLSQVEQSETEIESKVYEDTRSQHEEKYVITEKIEGITS